MMRISNKQRAIINSAVKPFKITSNYLGPGLQKLIKYYTKYFTKRRFSIIHQLPAYKNSRSNHILTVLFNTFLQKGGFAKKRRPLTWRFYGNTLLTKYGRKNQQNELKKRRKRAQSQKEKAATENVRSANVKTNAGNIASDNVIEIKEDSNDCDVVKIIPTTPNVQNSSSDTQNDSNSKEETSNHSSNGEPMKTWGSDLQSISKHFVDVKESELIENTNGNTDDESSEMSAAIESSRDSGRINCVDEESQDQSSKSSGGDINARIRLQLQLLKKGKSDKPLFVTKESRPIGLKSSNRRSDSNLSTESSTHTNFSNAKRSLDTTKLINISTENSSKEDSDTNQNAKRTDHTATDDSNKSKAIGGMIDSLFNKFQSMNSNLSRRSSKTKSSQSPTMEPAVPAKRTKRDDTVDSSLFASLDSNQDDSNQSATSMSMEFLGFDISNKNVDVSALLPTPKVQSSSDKAAFLSESLDTFMKENLLEKSNDQLSFTPKPCNRDEALMTLDALPPCLSAPKRPNDMQRPRTLAEKRMILQQQNDISILILENESTVYHELKKRMKLKDQYSNPMVHELQNTNIPFRRDCWRAASWISTSNNRFLYRTVLMNKNQDDESEIKLVGSRGDNPKKVAIELQSDEKLPANRSLNHIWNECRKKCPTIDEKIKINNIELIVDEDTSHSTKLLKKSKFCMFSREYLTPGPKCQKVKCKSNRKTSFDLEYGPLELVQLPTVQLEVWPQIGLPLSDHIKPLLKTIPTNSNVITADWAKFATSVVRETPKQIKNRRKYKKPDTERPEPIVFNIPYENNEKKILIRRRRRSSIVFNENDTVNEHIETFYQDKGDADNLTFRKNVDSTDALAVECADILTNMIESIAITVNDANFIKQDPDIDYVGKIMAVGVSKESTKTASKTEKEKNTKTEKTSKNKLIKELKRLNVTVIDTANDMAKSKIADEVCQKSFCKLGCICGSIDTAKYIQVHCQQLECMFECTCVNSPYKEANDFYLNDNSLDVLQARANARLARVEKEFKSTIIVSENDMYVLPNTITSTKRSSRKPKRFTNDDTCLDDTETETIFKSKRRRPEERVVVVESHPTLNKHRHNALKSLQHVRVEVKQLPELGVEPWCLVHHLYKCHCKGRAQKGRVFSFANKNNDLVGPGGWETTAPRKRQYTFERENANDEPVQKASKTTIAPQFSPQDEIPSLPSISSFLINQLTSARTRIFPWRKRPRRTQADLLRLRNECNFAENPEIIAKLNERIETCRKYNQAQNMLAKSMELGKLVPKELPLTNDHNTSKNESINHLNQVITETMQRLTALQQRNRLTLNPTPNKLSIIPWNRVLQAFKSHEIFVWDVELENHLRLMALTTTHVTPKDEKMIRVTNISYTELSKLPMVAKLLRNNYKTEKTKYLSMLLLRLTNFWRVCGVLHSDLKYMDDELRAKPSPDTNPSLSRKINGLYQLLTRRDMVRNGHLPTVSKITAVNESFDPQVSTDESNLTHSSNNGEHFVNNFMGLSLPIPCNSSQRILMISLGDDFTHLWIQNWRDFLSLRRIKHCLGEAKRLQKSIELTLNNYKPRVFVVHTHDSRIFIGPYEKDDIQNVALFVKHDNHMLLYENYYKQNVDATYTKKTKASWIYAHKSSSDKPKDNCVTASQLKINQVFSKNDMPPEFYTSSEHSYESNLHETSSTSTDPPVRSGFFTLTTSSNGIRTYAANSRETTTNTVPTRVSSKVYVPTKVRELSTNSNDINNSNQDPLPLKISSVVSGEEVSLLTNGFDMNIMDDMPKICDVQSLAQSSDFNIFSDEFDNEPSGNDLNHDDGDNDVNIDELPTYTEQTTNKSEKLNDQSLDMNQTSTKETIDDPILRLKGYIYCITNTQLGKVKIEGIPSGRIKIHLTEPIEIVCNDTKTARKNLEAVFEHMTSHVRQRFYAVYPTLLRLQWIFIRLDDSSLCSNLRDFNEINTFSVVFSDKVVDMNSNYLNDSTLSRKDKYVLDIYYLASQLFKEDEVKTMKITDIIKRSQAIDAQLDEQQSKLKKYEAHYRKMVHRFNGMLEGNGEKR